MHPRQTTANSRENPSLLVGPLAYPIKEAAWLMGLSLDTLERMIARRSIAIVQERPGAKRTILLTDINEYLKTHRVPAKTEVKS